MADGTVLLDVQQLIPLPEVLIAAKAVDDILNCAQILKYIVQNICRDAAEIAAQFRSPCRIWLHQFNNSHRSR